MKSERRRKEEETREKRERREKREFDSEKKQKREKEKLLFYLYIPATVGSKYPYLLQQG